MSPTAVDTREAARRDLDELSARIRSLGYLLDRTQLEPGRSACGIRVATGPHLTCVVESTEVAFENRAVTPAGRVTFGLRVLGEAPARYGGVPQSGDHIRVAPPESEVEIVTPGPQISAHLSFDQDWFQQFFATARLSSPQSAIHGEPHLVEHPRVARRLRALVSGTLRPGVETCADASHWTETLAIALADGLCRSQFDPHRGRGRRAPTRRYFRQAREYVDAHLSEPIHLSDLCAHVGVGLRTLQRAFREESGLTPLDYVRVRRLAAARRLLGSATSEGMTVAGIARACGLLHPGRFSASYQALYGEYPSEAARTRTSGRTDRGPV